MGGFGSVEFALKYENIPHEIVFAVEYAELQRKSYILNHGMPTGEFAKDIKTFDSSKYFDKIDYYHLSPPCQSFSMAGSRAGLEDMRGGLMLKAIESINEVQPKMFLIENVRGLLSSNGGEDWKNILNVLEQLKNYSISWHLLNAKDYGTPQNRERIFIVGFRADVNFSTPSRIKLKKSVLDIIQKDIDSKYYVSTANFKETINQKVSGLIQVGNIDTKGHNSIWGRVYSLTGIAPTQNANGGGMGAKTGLFAIGNKIRRLTPRECARLQGDFEDKFKFGDFSDTRLYEFIGNAMDISTTRALITNMLEVAKSAKWNRAERSEINFNKNKQLTLF